MKFKNLLRILALVLALSVLLAVTSTPLAEEYSIPTLYIDDRAWYMSSLYSLTEQNGAYLVPTSFVEAVDGIEITFDETRKCLLIQREDKYVSVNVNTQNALLHTGEVKKTTGSYINDVYFIDSELCAAALGFEVEIATFLEKTVLRIKTEDELPTLESLVERNQVSDSTPPNKIETTEAAVNRQSKNLSFIADFTKMTADDQTDFLSFTAKNKVKATIIIEKKNMTDTALLKNMISANAQGFSFVIRAKNTLEVSEYNSLLRTLLKTGTRLVIGPDGLKAPLEAIGYIALGQPSATASNAPQDYRFEAFTTIEIDDFTDKTRANVEKWIEAAAENNVFIAPLNQKTGH